METEKIEYNEVVTESGATKLIRADKKPSNPDKYLKSIGGKIAYIDLIETDKALIDAGRQPISDLKEFANLFFEMFNTTYKTDIKPLLIDEKSDYKRHLESIKPVAVADDTQKAQILIQDYMLKHNVSKKAMAKKLKATGKTQEDVYTLIPSLRPKDDFNKLLSAI